MVFLVVYGYNKMLQIITFLGRGRGIYYNTFISIIKKVNNYARYLYYYFF